MSSALDTTSLRMRLTVLAVVVICLFAALFARLWYLQVVNAPAARALAESNQVRIVYIPARRGEILDRYGRIIVGNTLTEVVTVDQDTAHSDPAMVSALAAVLNETPKTLLKTINDPKYNPYQPVPVAQDVPDSTVLTLDEHQSEFPGIQVTQETMRSYPNGVALAAANIVGYVGQINSTELKALKGKGYQPGDQIGQAGIEAEYESILRGKPGIEKLQVDSQGHVLGVIGYQPPVPGDNIRLSIDMNLQQAAVTDVDNGLKAARTQFDPVTKKNFAAPAGAAVVLDPQNGQVLALATDPDYDPAQFVGGISEANYQALLNNPNRPLTDRSIQGEYQPGSTFKLVTATAALQDGLITPTSIFDDKGGITVGGQHFSNDDGEVLGPIDLPTAITESSDAYFYTLGEEFWNDKSQFGETALQNVAHEYGFGSSTGLDLPNEAPGLIPTPAIVAKEHAQYPQDYPSGTWYTGDSVQTAIGEDQVLVTPLQLANAYATFANGGTLYAPRLAMDAETATGKVVESFVAPVKGNVTIPDRSALLAGFEGVVNNPRGTAYGTFQGFPLNQLLIAGKTGTAQVGGANQNTSVFTSFGPATNPDYVIDAFMEQAGYGASVAGPVVRNIWQEVLTEQQQGVPAPTASPAVGQTVATVPGSPVTVPTTTTTTGG